MALESSRLASWTLVSSSSTARLSEVVDCDQSLVINGNCQQQYGGQR
jgi:hypothetical protein